MQVLSLCFFQVKNMFYLFIGFQKELGPKLGYRIPMGDYYYYTHYLDINNCWMVVSKEKFATEFVLLKLTVFNMAMEHTQYNMTVIAILFITTI